MLGNVRFYGTLILLYDSSINVGFTKKIIILSVLKISNTIKCIINLSNIACNFYIDKFLIRATLIENKIIA